MSIGGDCEYWKGLLAMEAVGQGDHDDRSALAAHLEGCRQCQADRVELFSVVSALGLADGAFLKAGASRNGGPEPSGTSATLDAGVLTLLSRAPSGSGSPRRTVRRTLVWSALAVSAGVIVVVTALSLFGQASPTTRTVALRGHQGNYATAVLASKPWGTSIELSDHGERSRQDLTVSMQAEYGRHWLAGSYNSGATGDVRVVLACALPIQQIRRIVVTDSSGHEVLKS